MIEPIKNINDITDLEKQLLLDYSYKHYVFFKLSINTGLLCNKALNLRWDGIFKNKNSKYFSIKNKLGKERQIYLNNTCVKILNKLRKLYPNDVWMFQTDRKLAKGDACPWSCNYPYSFLTKAAKTAGLTQEIGAHSSRKTFGYHAVKSGNWTISELSAYFSQYSQKKTQKYICWDGPVDTPSYRPEMNL